MIMMLRRELHDNSRRYLGGGVSDFDSAFVVQHPKSLIHLCSLTTPTLCILYLSVSLA